MSFSFVFKNQLLRYSFLLLILFPVSVFANVQEETSKGDAAFKMGKMKKAEKDDTKMQNKRHQNQKKLKKIKK